MTSQVNLTRILVTARLSRSALPQMVLLTDIVRRNVLDDVVSFVGAILGRLFLRERVSMTAGGSLESPLEHQDTLLDDGNSARC